MDDYQRWSLLEALLPHIDQGQFSEVRQLIDSMEQGGLAGQWHALAFAHYTAERARRGDDDAVREAMSIPRDAMKWWCTVAALFALRKEGIFVDLEELSLAGEANRAADQLEGSFSMLEAMAGLVATLPDLASSENRSALARFLQQLRLKSDDRCIRLAAEVGKCLPQPHAMRLLNWARTKLQWRAQSGDPNINWYHTPPSLAVALAHIGELCSALDVIWHTKEHPYFQPKAIIDVVTSFRRSKAARPRDLFVALGDDRMSDNTRLEIFAAVYDSLELDQRVAVLNLLDQRRLRLGKDLPILRCRVLAHLSSHATWSDAEHPSLLRLAETLPDYERDEVLELLAERYSTAGRADRAIEALSAVQHRWNLAEAWTSSIAAAPEPALHSLLGALSDDAPLVREILQRQSCCRKLKKVIERARAELLPLLEKLALVDRARQSDLPVAVARRAFELGATRQCVQILAQSGNPWRVLPECLHLPVDRREAFIELASVPPMYDCARWQAQARIAADAMTEAQVERDPDEGVLAATLACFEGTKFLETLSVPVRQSFVNAYFNTRLRDARASEIAFSKWLLPWLDAGQIAHLLEVSRAARDDYRRDEGIVLLLAHVVAHHGLAVALKLRNQVRRPDLEAASWVALWPHLPDDDRAQAFVRLTSEGWSERKHVAEGLGEIAAQLSPQQLRRAAEWIATHHSGDQAALMRPLVEAACRLPAQHSYEIWDCVLTTAARKPCEDAVRYLYQAVPLAEYLGGANALRTIEACLARAAAQWP
ncbi:hypothetical protein ACVWXO_000425 [Bradyrhizobium sp. LM2.7]